jgi:hypothetical protein
VATFGDWGYTRKNRSRTTNHLRAPHTRKTGNRPPVAEVGLQRGWLHGRELTQPWHVERIVEKLGDQCWFSHFWRDKQTADAGNLNLKPIAIAGFWPSGGFIELLMKDANPLDEHPRGTLAVYSEAPTKTEALMTELFDHYRHSESATDSQPRVGILNYSYNSLSVERIPITSNQTVARERVDLFYGDGAIA